MNVPAPALNVPPVPEVCVHVPPACSPVIKLNKLIGVTLESHIVVFPSTPAFGWAFTVTVLELEIATVQPGGV